MDRRMFIKMTGKAVAGLSASIWESGELDDLERQHLHVNIPSYDLTLYGEDGSHEETYSCRIGTPDTPSPTGRGIVSQKHDTPRFYDDTGDVIETVNLEPLGIDKEVPYERMRSLFTRWWDSQQSQYVNTGEIIHPTEQYWTIGYPYSDGCIVLETEDMLDLYQRIKAPLPTIESTYRTVRANDNMITVWSDIYDRETTTISALMDVVEEPDQYSMKAIIANLNTIDSWLDVAYQQVTELLANGKNPHQYDIDLSYTVDQSVLLTEPVPPPTDIGIDTGNEQIFMSSSQTE